MIHVFLGTKAQYIKTAPLLHLMDRREVPYRLIDAGQHAALSVGLRDELGVRAPDVVLGGSGDVDTIPQMVAWSARLAARLVSRRRLRAEVFAGAGGICVVHGDTPSTLLAALLARRAGLTVAHLEAGLRSHRMLDPFPEELIRVVVMRLSHLLFAPDDEALGNLRRMRLRGRVVALPANTVVEAVRDALPDPAPRPGSGPVIATMHRVENLTRPARVAGFVRLVCDLASSYAVRVVVHGPTREVLGRRGDLQRLDAAGVTVDPLQPHAAFVGMLSAAPFVVTDGGSIQEECAILGVPCLLWRRRSERPDGIGRNVVVSRHDAGVVRRFLADPQALRTNPANPDVAPSTVILDALLDAQAGTAGTGARSVR